MNPFDLTVIADGAPFCDRQEQQEDLLKYAEAGANVVLFGARRFGKTSLVRRAHQRFRDEFGGIAIYVDLYRVTSVASVAERIARGVYRGLSRHKSFTEKGRDWLYSLRDYRPVMRPDPSAVGGIAYSVEKVATRPPLEQLRSTLEDIERFAEAHDMRVCLALDEFQDIVDLGDPEIEAMMREVIQDQKRVAYFFAGSRRSVLVQMFSSAGRPFYHSAHMMEIKALPPADLKKFILDQFEAQGRKCQEQGAELIVELSGGAPYYAQAIAFQAFALDAGPCTPETVHQAFDRLLGSERNGYEAILRGLTDAQVIVLDALAEETTDMPTGKDFLARTGLSVGGVRKSLDRLRDMDVAEQEQDGFWKVVDPVFGTWIRRSRT